MSGKSKRGRQEWTDEELEIIRPIRHKWPRNAKLTAEQVIEIRRRVDSLSVPWSIKEIARDYGISVVMAKAIARRKHWDDLAYEPDNAEWWWRVEREQRAQQRRSPRRYEHHESR